MKPPPRPRTRPPQGSPEPAPKPVPADEQKDSERAREQERPQPGAQAARPRRISSQQISTGNIDGNKNRDGNKDSVQRQPAGGLTSAVPPGAAVSPVPRVPVISTGMADRLAEKEAISRTLRNRKLIWWGTGVTIVLAAVWAVFYSPLLAMDPDEVTVNGTGTFVTADQVTDSVAHLAGTPLARISMAQVHDSVSGLTNVRDVVQTRKWPKGLTITIQERIPVAAVPEGKKFALLDMDAVIVARQDEAPPELPMIELALTEGKEKTLASVLGVLDQLTEEMLADVASISAASQDSVDLKLRNGILVHWGSSDETELKLQVLLVLLEKAEEDGIKLIDLSAPTFPITK